MIERMFEQVGVSVWDTVYTDRDPQQVLDELLVTEPGPWMLAVLVEIREQVHSEVGTDRQRETLLRCWERVTAWTLAQRAEVMVDAAASQAQVTGPFGVDDFGADLIALLTGDTIATASVELDTARLLGTDLPGCRSALERGEISWRMVTDVTRAVPDLQPWQRAAVDARMVTGWAIDRDLSRWRRRLRRAVLCVDDDAETRRTRAVTARSVISWPLPDGMACVHAELPAHDAATVMAALTALADRYGLRDRETALAHAQSDCDHTDPHTDDAGEGSDWVDPETFQRLATLPPGRRTVDQRRADALVALCTDALSDPTLPKRQGQRPTVQATGGILTLLGLRDDPGELAGYGPITAQHLRELAADADWQRFLTAPDTGALIAIGTTTYRPNQALRAFMTGAQPTCDFPGCPIPATHTDAEHTVAHDHGGPTDEHNLRPRCRRHHRCKTHANWTVEQLPDDTTKWTAPSGSYRIITPHQLAGDEPDDDEDDSS